MKSIDEIQRAHDVLVAYIIGEMPDPFEGQPYVDRERAWQAIRESCSVLCWLLGCEHNPNFACNLLALEAHAKAHGFVLERKNN